MLQIVIQVIRSKFVAVLLGPQGMGIVGLLISTLGLLATITSFGLGTSAVRNVAAAKARNNEEEIWIVVAVVKRLVWITGLLGALITLFFSAWLSELTFGSTDYTYAFIWLSITILLNQLSTGQKVLLQGLREIKSLAKANVLGSFIALLVTVPFYYYLGVSGIVPVILLSSIVTLLLSWYFSNKIEIKRTTVSIVETYVKGKGMLFMGFMISLSSLLTASVSYILRVYIGNVGGLDDVGLYSAGFAIISTYVGLIFTAMGTDYYPRLSAVAGDNYKSKKAINQQAEVSILILGPILVAFIIFIKFVTIILYSHKFVGITSMLQWQAIGMFFKATSWSIAFVFLAKGDIKIFSFNELFVNIYLLVLSIVGYKYYNLTGLGVAFSIGYFFYLLQVYVITYKKYKFSFDYQFVKVFAVQFTLVSVVFISTFFLSETNVYITGCVMMTISAYYSFVELDRRMDIKKIVSRLMIKN